MKGGFFSLFPLNTIIVVMSRTIFKKTKLLEDSAYVASGIYLKITLLNQTRNLSSSACGVLWLSIKWVWEDHNQVIALSCYDGQKNTACEKKNYIYQL